ncbi:hypothetical protein J1N35_028480 [Gossypium stocksii]|uniref:Uncharacterized protein n=1 Tax=Gossypium stocksii TaxID=47602 RepID=A0A9D3UWB3_9ROSI|nr:hypothetical protein J1N35_028480 [Gossypium stocksii]
MKSTMANLWHPVRGVQIQDLGEKREENDSQFEGDGSSSQSSTRKVWEDFTKGMSGRIVDPILRFNLEGGSSTNDLQSVNLNMDHVMEDGILIREEGKKRARTMMEEISERD